MGRRKQLSDDQTEILTLFAQKTKDEPRRWWTAEEVFPGPASQSLSRRNQLPSLARLRYLDIKHDALPNIYWYRLPKKRRKS